MSGHAITSFEDLVDLASERLGGAAIWCSDDFFAGMENLVKAKEAVWLEDAYTDRGKWMDGWESKRSHQENHGNDHEDACIVRLGAPGVVRGVVVDTAFFRGNYAAFASLEGCVVDGYPSGKEIAERADWQPLLPKSALEGNSKNKFAVTSSTRVTHVRLRMYPDGGIARLRVYGEPLPDWKLHGSLEGELELSSAELGGLVVSCSDMFFGSRHNLLFPGLSGGMHDGWETRRARRPGFDWAVVRLAARGRAARVVVDTSHFKGNCPESFALDGAVGDAPDGANDAAWSELVPRVALQPHTRHVFLPAPAPSSVSVSHVRLRVFPDGGVARFRLFGKLDDDERAAQRVRRLNAMSDREANTALLSCCGSMNWAMSMASARPFADWRGVESASERAFAQLTEDDWLEAFRAHPRIGGKKPEGTATSTSKTWSSAEQAGMGSADDAIRLRMAARNDEYLAKFGFIYILMATGKSATEILEILESRVANDRQAELKNAANEQRKITALRLQRLQ